MLLYLSYKILYTWQVVGVGAGYIINVFNYKLYREGPTLTFVNHLLRVQLQVVLGGPTPYPPPPAQQPASRVASRGPGENLDELYFP